MGMILAFYSCSKSKETPATDPKAGLIKSLSVESKYPDQLIVYSLNFHYDSLGRLNELEQLYTLPTLKSEVSRITYKGNRLIYFNAKGIQSNSYELDTEGKVSTIYDYSNRPWLSVKYDDKGRFNMAQSRNEQRVYSTNYDYSPTNQVIVTTSDSSEFTQGKVITKHNVTHTYSAAEQSDAVINSYLANEPIIFDFIVRLALARVNGKGMVISEKREYESATYEYVRDSRNRVIKVISKRHVIPSDIIGENTIHVTYND